MGAILKLLLGTLSWQQILTWFFSVAAVAAIQHFVPAGNLQTLLLAADANIVALLQVILRKPSANGGTVNAVTAPK